jgi:hypothetical protein
LLIETPGRTINFETYRAVIALQSRVPRECEPCWIQDPVIFEDALGRVVPLHLELVNSWEVLESVLAARFKNLPGHRKIQQKEYAFQERASKRDLDRALPWEACFQPGRRVDMSMIFKGYKGSGSSCPGCQLATEKSEDSEIKW